jgi:hypothetical protein
MMNTVNKSTGFSGFQLRMGCSPHLVPPLVDQWEVLANEDLDPAIVKRVVDVIDRLELDVLKSKDNLLYVKIFQAHQQISW